MNKVRTLAIHTTQGFSGELTRESQYVFNYQTKESACEISVTMPLRAQSYSGNILPGVLRQNLPEGYLDSWLREKLAKVMKLDDMTILAITGRDVIGRVRCFQEGDDGTTKFPGVGLNDLLTWKGTEDLFQLLAEQYALASGISGVQPKVMVPALQDTGRDVIDKSTMKDRDWIVKSSGDEYPALAENEFICMTMAKNAGLEVPKFWLSDDRKLFIVERFDMNEHGYLGFEDMTALMNKQNANKYESSYEMVAKAVSLFTSPAHTTTSLNELFASVTLSMLVRNGDAHLKNFGILYTDPKSTDCRLSPLYDIVNTTAYIPRDVPALSLNGVKAWPSTKDLVEYGKKHCRVDRPEQVIERIATAVMDYRPAEKTTIWAKMQPALEYACFGLATKGLVAASKGASSDDALPANAKTVESGRYIGEVRAVTTRYVAQDSGRGVLVAHPLGALERTPAIGEKLDVQYVNGKPTLRETQSAAVAFSKNSGRD